MPLFLIPLTPHLLLLTSYSLLLTPDSLLLTPYFLLFKRHVGHLRSTIIGETICRVLTSCGHDVLRINHVGDWGTQFGMLLCHLNDNHPNFHVVTPDISNLNKFYKEAKKRFDNEPEFKERSRLMVPKLQGGDERALAGWKALYEVSKVQFSQVYERLDITCELFGESEYNSMIPSVVNELRSKNLLTDDVNKDNGLVAQVAWVKDAIDNPLFLVKSDGGYGYDSTDAAAIQYRIKDLQSSWLIYVTDMGQCDHFRGIFSLANRAGWLGLNGKSNVMNFKKDKMNENIEHIVRSNYKGEGKEDDNVRVDHVGFGVVQGKDKKRFKTRSGETVRLVDLLDEAKRRVGLEISTRLKDGTT